ATKRALDLVLKLARSVGGLTDIRGALYVNLQNLQSKESRPGVAPDFDQPESSDYEIPLEEDAPPVRLLPSTQGSVRTENRRVFITHGKNKAFIDPLK